MDFAIKGTGDSTIIRRTAKLTTIMITDSNLVMPSTSDVEYFSTIPWVSALLSEPNHIQYIPTCRLQPSPGVTLPTKDQFFRVNLNNTGLIPHVTAFYQYPFANPSSPPSTEQAAKSQQKRLLIENSTLVLSLQPGTNGYNGTAHGGLISTLIDEAMGSLIFINHQYHDQLSSSSPELIPENVLDMHGVAMFTANMNVRFKAPLPTPQIILVEAKVRGLKGRKVFIDVEVKNNEGAVYATCEGMWMSVDRKEKL